MQEEEARLIPLYGTGNRVVAYAQVDEADYTELSRYKWRLSSRGYAERRVVVLMHRQILGIQERDTEVDHIDGARLDNRRRNLRTATRAQNAQNRRSRPGTASQFRGVTWMRRRTKWRAVGKVNGTRKHLGYFETEAEANAVVTAWRAEHMPYSLEGQTRAALHSETPPK